MSDAQPLIVDLTDQPIAKCTPAQASRLKIGHR